MNHEQVVSIVPTDKSDLQNTVLHLDTIQFTDIACIIYPIVLFIAYNVNEHFGTDFNEFKTEYIHFMEQKKMDSFFVYLMEHPPKFDEL